jgi:hypothetical protein
MVTARSRIRTDVLSLPHQKSHGLAKAFNERMDIYVY